MGVSIPDYAIITSQQALHAQYPRQPFDQVVFTIHPLDICPLPVRWRKGDQFCLVMVNTFLWQKLKRISSLADTGRTRVAICFNCRNRVGGSTFGTCSRDSDLRLYESHSFCSSGSTAPIRMVFVHLPHCHHRGLKHRS